MKYKEGEIIVFINRSEFRIVLDNLMCDGYFCTVCLNRDNMYTLRIEGHKSTISGSTPDKENKTGTAMDSGAVC